MASGSSLSKMNRPRSQSRVNTQSTKPVGLGKKFKVIGGKKFVQESVKVKTGPNSFKRKNVLRPAK